MNTVERPRPARFTISLKLFESLHSPPYRTYLAGSLGFFAGMSMNQVTSPLLVFRLTGSSVLLGTMSLVASLPLIIMSLFGGAIADRLQKKHIMFVCFLLFIFTALGIGIALNTGAISPARSGSWAVLLASSFIQSGLMGMLIPAQSAIVAEVVKREQLLNAIALNTLGMNVLGLIAPAFAGVIIDHLGFHAVYYIMAGLYAYAAAFAMLLPRSGPAVVRGSRIVTDIKAGLNYIRHHAHIRSVLLFTTAMVVLVMPYQQLLPIFTDRILKVGATGMGILMGAAGGGALAGSLIMAAIPARRRGVMLLGGALVAGLALAGFAFSAIWAVSLGLMVFVGLANTIRNTVGSALLQAYAEPGYMGRVMSLMNMQWGVMALCTFFAGVMANIITVQWVVGALAIALILVTVMSTLLGPSLRKLD